MDKGRDKVRGIGPGNGEDMGQGIEGGKIQGMEGVLAREWRGIGTRE